MSGSRSESLLSDSTGTYAEAAGQDSEAQNAEKNTSEGEEKRNEKKSTSEVGKGLKKRLALLYALAVIELWA